MILTKNYYLPETITIARSLKPMFDIGYSLDIPHNPVYNTGWQFSKPDTWGKEHLLITRPDPEFYAPDNLVRSNGVVPEININDPIYSFNRENYTYDAIRH